jgi:hypothetical protein
MRRHKARRLSEESGAMTERRFPNVSPEREAVLLRVEALYAEHMTMREVAEASGLTMLALEHISRRHGLSSTEEARMRTRGRYEGAKRMKTKADREALAHKLRGFIATEHCTIIEAARRLGLGVNQAYGLARDFGIAAAPGAVIAAHKTGGKAGAEKQRSTTAPAPPNPHRTPAQQAQIAQMSVRMWAGRSAQFVPPPANADQLVAEALAQGRVTKCPPRYALPINNGDGK